MIITEQITPEMREKLRAPLPEGAVTQHPTKIYLSSIKAIYVTERLNDVFGVGGWQLETNMVERGEGGTVVVKVKLSIPRFGVYLESFGGNDNGGENSKNFDLGDAYKGATTDGVTKIGSYLEIGIDVFKGLHGKKIKNESSTPTKSPSSPKPLEWLNEGTPNWDHIVKRITDTTSPMTIEQVKTLFKVSKTSEEKLKKLIK